MLEIHYPTFLFYRWGDGGMEWLNNLFKVSHTESSRARTRAWAQQHHMVGAGQGEEVSDRSTPVIPHLVSLPTFRDASTRCSLPKLHHLMSVSLLGISSYIASLVMHILLTWIIITWIIWYFYQNSYLETTQPLKEPSIHILAKEETRETLSLSS